MSKGIAEEVAGGAMIAAGILIPGGAALSVLGFKFTGAALAGALIEAGAGLALQPIGTMLDGKEPG